MAARIAAIVLAGGRGTRSGGDLPKQYRELDGEPVIAPSLRLFLGHPQISLVQPVIHPDDQSRYAAAATGLDLPAPVMGGATRQDSVLAGLNALERAEPDFVLIHDSARPFAHHSSGRSRDRGGAGERRCDPGSARHRYGEGGRRAGARDRETIDRATLAPDPDAAGLRLSQAAGRASARGAGRPA